MADAERSRRGISESLSAYVNELKAYLRGLVRERQNPATRTATKGDVDAAAHSVEKKTEEVKTKVEKVQATTEKVQATTEETNRKADVVIVKQEDIRKTVNRIDKRDKKGRKNARMRFSVEVQEAAFGYWERGQKKAALKSEAARRVSREQVFDYYRPEFAALGIRTTDDFKSCLGARADRIARTRMNE